MEENITTPVEAPVEAPAPAEPVSDVRLVVGEDGSRTVEFGATSETPSAEAPAETEAPAEQPAENKNFYTDTEYIEAFGNNNVDMSRVSPEQMAFMQAQRNAYEMQKHAEMVRAQQYQEAQNKLLEQRRQALAGLSATARQKALEKLSLTEETLADAEFLENGEEIKQNFQNEYERAFSAMQYELVQKEFAEHQRMQEHHNVMTEIGSFIQQEKMTEPHHDKILQLMDTSMDRLPYDVAVQLKDIQNRVSSGSARMADISVLRAFYDECKKAIYQNEYNVSKVPKRTQPPKVEGAGVPKAQNKPSLNMSALGSMSQLQRDEAVRQFILSSM